MASRFWVELIVGTLVTILQAVAAEQPDSNTTAWRKMSAIEPRGYVCYRANHPINIDGRITPDEWSRAPWTEDFIDIEGTPKPRPQYRTRAKLLWDDQYLYVAAELEEPHVWGTLTTHDSVIFQDNDFEVFIDPNSDSHEYYEFEMNALNTTWDLFLKKPYKDGGRAKNGWEIRGLKSAVSVQGTINNPSDIDHGWTVELAFPWKALGKYAHVPAPPGSGDQWRINFSRVEWPVTIRRGRYWKVRGAKENNWVWSPQGIVDMHRPEKWGFLQFSRAESGDEFNADPASTAKNILHEIYYSQRDYRAAHGRWAKSIAELGITLPESNVKPELSVKKDGFECSLDFQGARWHILQDAKLWRD